MKKEYQRPEIIFECFSLSTCIAACDRNIGATRGVCALKNDNGIAGLDIFTTEMTNCGLKESDDEYDTFCYHVFDGNNMFFSSL